MHGDASDKSSVRLVNLFHPFLAERTPLLVDPSVLLLLRIAFDHISVSSPILLPNPVHPHYYTGMGDIRAAEVILEAIEASKIKLQTIEKQYQDAQQLLDRCKALYAIPLFSFSQIWSILRSGRILLLDHFSILFSWRLASCLVLSLL